MGPALTTIIAAMIGALSAGFAHLLQVQLEKNKLRTNRKDNEIKEFKLEIAHAIKVMMNFCHQMCWVTWYAKILKDKNPVANYDDYNSTAHKFLTDLTEKLAIIAATDLECYNVLQQTGSYLIELDAKIGTAIVEVTYNASNDFTLFTELSEETSRMEKNLPTCFSQVMNLAETNMRINK